MDKQQYDPEIEYDKIISWLANNINVDEGRYIRVCSMISEYGLAMYEKGCGEAIEVITNRIKQYTDDKECNGDS